MLATLATSPKLLLTIGKITSLLAHFWQSHPSTLTPSPLAPAPAAPVLSQSVESRVQQLKLSFKLPLVEALVKQLEKNKALSASKEEVSPAQAALDLMYVDLHQIVEQIHEQLTEVKTRREYHQTKWFASWRTLDCDEPLAKLQELKSQLDDGFNLLMATWLPLHLSSTLVSSHSN